MIRRHRQEGRRLALAGWPPRRREAGERWQERAQPELRGRYGRMVRLGMEAMGWGHHVKFSRSEAKFFFFGSFSGFQVLKMPQVLHYSHSSQPIAALLVYSLNRTERSHKFYPIEQSQLFMWID
jgi:hypothetical protein